MKVIPIIGNRPTTDLRKQIQAILAGGFPRSGIVTEAGVRGRLLEQWLAGTIVDELTTQKLAAWVAKVEKSRSDQLEPDYVETPTGERISGALEFAHMTPSITVIYGPAGLGKTVAVSRYAQSCAYNSAVHVKAGEFNKTPTALLELITDKLGVVGHAYRVDALMGAIIREIRSPGLIIIDEAQHLSMNTLDGLRYLYDEGGIGLALVGNEMVFTQIARGRRAMFAQLESRVGMYLSITRPEMGDLDAVLAAWGVSGRDERSLAERIAAAPGALRVLAHVLRQASLAARGMGRPLDAALMRGALDARGGLMK